MQKRASRKKGGNPLLVFGALPASSDTPIFRDKGPVPLPFAESFPKLHFHDRYEIGLCVEGEGLFLSEGEFFSVTPGDAVFFPPGRQHYSRSIDSTSLCRFRFAYIFPDAVAAVLDTLPGLQKESVMASALHIPSVLREKSASRIVEALTSTGMYADAVTLLSFTAFLSEFSAEQIPTTPASTEEVGMESALAAHISLHYSENETSEKLAALFHLSESQLRRRFVALYGMPPIAYRNFLRCKIGAELLLRTDITINVLSEQLGFSSPAEFYRSFKKQFGIAPSEFRKAKK